MIRRVTRGVLGWKAGVTSVISGTLISAVFVLGFAIVFSQQFEVTSTEPALVKALARQADVEVGTLAQYTESAERERLLVLLLIGGFTGLFATLLDEILGSLHRIQNKAVGLTAMILFAFFCTFLIVVLRTGFLGALLQLLTPFDVSFGRNDVVGMQASIALGISVPLIYRFNKLVGLDSKVVRLFR